MLLVHELLDEQVNGRGKKPMGKVDGIVLEMRTDHAPRVVCLELGGLAAAARIRGPLGWLLRACARRFGARKGTAYRIAWSKVRRIDLDVDVDVDADETEALHWDRVARKIIMHIPGA